MEGGTGKRGKEEEGWRGLKKWSTEKSVEENKKEENMKEGEVATILAKCQTAMRPGFLLHMETMMGPVMMALPENF